MRLRTLAISAAVAVSAVLGLASSAFAAGCPSSPVPQLGGTHTCFDAGGTHGHVHYWTPQGYDPKTAITVIYIHGYDFVPPKNGPDTCNGKRPYVDCIWDASDHNIVGQFSASGVNALFVAIDAPVNNNEVSALKGWFSLEPLLSALGKQLKEPPPQDVTVIAHSGGMYTATSLKGDARVKHLASLDWVQGSLESQVDAWFNQGGGRKLTLVGGSGGQQTIMDGMQTALGCTRAASPSSLSETELGVPCLYMRTSTSHMGTVFTHNFIPQVIKRSSAAATAGASTVVPSTPAIGGSSGTIAPGLLIKPVLEIPIPGVNFGEAVRANGTLSLPFLANYLNGVYSFLIGIVGLVAAVMMIIGGFQYLTSAGDASRLSAGKKRIYDALLGLTLAFGSYILLYTINPDLVNFKSLQFTDVRVNVYNFAENDAADVVPVDANGAVTQPQQTSGGGRAATLPNAVCHTRDGCKTYCENPSQRPASWTGIMDPSLAVPIKDAPGLSGNGFTASAEVRDDLVKAGAIAFAMDPEYRISIGDAYRPLTRQFNLACPHLFPNDDGHTGGLVAWPGSSLHGAGFATDVHFYKGKVELSNKNATPEPYSKLLDQIMFQAGFRRYTAELWHYEPIDAPYVNGCRCVYPNCPWPPPPPSDCTKGGGFR